MTDCRVRKTQKAIKGALIQLLKQHPFEQITIQHIADEADINRATFYQHYLDKYDLLDQIEDEVLFQIQRNFQQNAQKVLSESDEQERKVLLSVIPEGVLHIISEDLERFQILLNVQRNGEMERKIGEAISSNLKSLFPGAEVINGVPFRYFHAFVVGSMFSVIKTWILDEHRPSIEQQAAYISQLMYQGPWSNIIEESQKHDI